jgi:hypothetical protein
MGRHLLERGLPPGPDVGQWVREAFERQLDGELRTLDDALAWVDARRKRPGAAEGEDAAEDAP